MTGVVRRVDGRLRTPLPVQGRQVTQSPGFTRQGKNGVPIKVPTLDGILQPRRILLRAQVDGATQQTNGGFDRPKEQATPDQEKESSHPEGVGVSQSRKPAGQESIEIARSHA